MTMRTRSCATPTPLSPRRNAAGAAPVRCSRNASAHRSSTASSSRPSCAAVEARSFEIEYQPIVILHNRRIAGVEALLRWRHSTRGEIPPSTFLPVADELGLSPALARWVLHEACAQVKTWQDQVATARALTLTVNVSRAQLRQPSLVADVANALEVSALDPRRLVLEVSDAVLLDDAGTALARLQSLKSLGVRIAIDDFGARQAALHQLPRIPVDILKIDK